MWSLAALRDHRSEAGFTLIEAVVALALVSVFLAAIGSLIAAARIGTRTLEEHVALVETARLVAATFARRDELFESELRGEISGYSWRAAISPVFDEAGAVAVSAWVPQNVVVRVQSPSGAVFVLETIRLLRGPGR
jgi:general secretion pathway protein I